MGGEEKIAIRRYCVCSVLPAICILHRMAAEIKKKQAQIPPAIDGLLCRGRHGLSGKRR
jgi:hypothetical protein